jgi:hypothetical protein
MCNIHVNLIAYKCRQEIIQECFDLLLPVKEPRSVHS